VIHDLGYVSIEHYSDNVLKINMRIKQDRTPSVPLELDQIGVSPRKEKIHGSILWSNASIDENMTIDLIVNAITPIEVVLHILQHRPSEGISSFETLNYVIRNISKDIDVGAKNKFKPKSGNNKKQNPRE
jgi:hypothetical protein